MARVGQWEVLESGFELSSKQVWLDEDDQLFTFEQVWGVVVWDTDRVEITIEHDAGRFVARSVHLRVERPDGAVAAADLRLPMAAIVEKIVARETYRDGQGGGIAYVWQPVGKEGNVPPASLRRQRVRRVTPDLVAKAARIYDREVARGHRAPMKAVQEELSDTNEPLARSTTGRWIADAEERGLLSQEAIAFRRRGRPR